MSDSDECVITFPIVGGIFRVSRLATKRGSHRPLPSVFDPNQSAAMRPSDSLPKPGLLVEAI